MKSFIEEKSKMRFPLNIQLFAEGEDGGNPEDDEGSDDEEEIEDDDKGSKTFTQEEVNKMMAREKRQGRLSVYKALGIDPKNKEQVERAKALLKGNEDKKDTKESDNGGSDNSESERKLKEAERRANEAECKVKAVELGAKPKYVSDIILLVMARMNEGDEFADVLTEVKEMYPSMFGSVESEQEDEDDKDTKGKGKDKGKKDTGKSLGDFIKGGKGNKGKSLGARLAENQSRKAKESKSIFD